MSPAAGVRYEMALRESEGQRAVYVCTVVTPSRSDVVIVLIDGASSRVGGSAGATEAGMEPAHLTQLLAIAKTLGKRADQSPWPRKVNRWRSPGVR